MQHATLRLIAWILIAAAACSAQPASQEPAAPPDTDAWRVSILRGRALQRLGDYNRAAAVLRGALRDASQPGASPSRIVITLNLLGLISQELGRLVDSEQYYRRALAILDGRGDRGADYGSILSNLSLVYLRQGHTATATTLLREGLEIQTRLLPSGDFRLAASRLRFASLLLGGKSYAQAEPLILQAIPVFDKSTEYREHLGLAWNSLAVLRSHQGRPQEAIALLEQALELLRKELGPEHPWLVHPLINAGSIYLSLGRRAEAETALQLALAIVEKSLGTSHPSYARVLATYADLLRKTGRKSEARRLEAKSREAAYDNARANGLGMSIDASALRSR